MGYFPFFMDLTKRKGVIVGGGTVAARKIEKLIAFGPELTAVAPVFSDSVCRLEKRLQHGNAQEASLTLVQREVVREDLKNAAFVIAATDDEAVNARIAAWCNDEKIPVNVVDDREKCTFFFPALVKEGPLTIGISTDGKSPAAAGYVRKEISQHLPEGLGVTIELLGQLRPEVMEMGVDQESRADILEKLFFYSLRKNGEVTLSELRELLHGMK